MNALNNLIVGCVGVKGSGKTHALRRMIPFAPCAAVIDPTALLFDLVPNPFSQPEQVFEFLDWSSSQQSFAFGYCPEEPLGERVADIVPALLARGNMLVAFDEIPEICDGGRVPKRVRYLIRVGRHSGIDIAYTGQRFAEIPRTVTSQTDIFILFRQSEPLDLDGIARRAGREVAERVKNLGPHEFIVYDVRTQGEVPFDVSMFSSDSEARGFSGLTHTPEEEKENAAEWTKAKSVGSR
ncbi:MAG: hypothetical protein WA876_01150 [Candidatus Acidiferrales bacterium]